MLRRIVIALLLLAAFIWANNTSFLVRQEDGGKPRLLSHRGVHQIFAGDTVRNDTCTANPVQPITHGFIENTIPSMRAAFEAGADVVEIDVHLTPDNIFAVFHDWTVDCRTNGTGQTNEIPFYQLQTLDVAYRYSADGETFPLRGSGLGLIPSLTDVLDTFPKRKFLINFKSNRRSEGLALTDLLENSEYQSQVFGVYGGSKPTQVVVDQIDGLRGFDRTSVKACLLRYAALGWSGYFPHSCRSQIIAVPINYAPLLWGWPLRFQERMAANNTEIILVGPYDGAKRTIGIDTPELLGRVPEGFSGYIWTNEIDQISSWQSP
ncbi:MAG: glycerophosphodiester phosphodiesterase family protein [Methyloceanibacter sp.]|nr:glycerophosphodiester phosphodiesterase family protein [Methyloceanibacter sp.]